MTKTEQTAFDELRIRAEGLQRANTELHEALGEAAETVHSIRHAELRRFELAKALFLRAYSDAIHFPEADWTYAELAKCAVTAADEFLAVYNQ